MGDQVGMQVSGGEGAAISVCAGSLRVGNPEHDTQVTAHRRCPKNFHEMDKRKRTR